MNGQSMSVPQKSGGKHRFATHRNVAAQSESIVHMTGWQ
jgi:hypothetical protein